MTEWKKYRVKDVARLIGSGATPTSGNDRYYENGIHYWVNTGDFNNSEIYGCKQLISDTAIREIPTLRFYPINTILVAMYGASIGKVGILKVKATVNQACCAIALKENLFSSRFLFYLLINCKDSLLKESFGGTQPNVSKEIIANLIFKIPSLQVQQRIVEYLDAKTTEIDNKIELLGKKRDAYKRLKIATINHAVIRGLDEHVKLKDTDIDWIGEIPVHWETRRIKDEVEVNKLTLTESTSPMYKFRYIDISNVSSEGVISFIEEVYFYEAPSRARRIVQKGDIIVSTVRTYLKSIGMIDFDAKDVVVSTGFAVLSPIKSYSKYFYYLLRSNHLIDEICALSSGVSYPAIAATRIESINIPVPPLEEQKQIAAYLDDRCAKIDEAVTIIDKQIDALKRLKRSLINEVVTGKRMV